MGYFFDFGDIEKIERDIRKTWSEFREALSKGCFTYNEVEKAKKCTFLKVYNDLFHDNSGIDHNTLNLKELRGVLAGRGCVLEKDEVIDYERFIPKKEFIKTIIDSAHLGLNGYIWQLEMKLKYINVLKQNVERILEMNLASVTISLMMLLAMSDLSI